MQGVFDPCLSPVYENPTYLPMAEKVTSLYVGNVSPFALPFLMLPFVAGVAFLIVIVLAPWWRDERVTGYALIIAVTVILYGVFLGLFNVAEAGRFTANIQDLAILSMLIFVGLALSQLRRATLGGVLKLWKEQ